MTTFLRSHTLASLPKCCLKMPMVPGPQTSCVMSTSTSTQMLSPGWTASRPAWRARIFSVKVIGVIYAGSQERQQHTENDIIATRQEFDMAGFRLQPPDCWGKPV